MNSAVWGPSIWQFFNSVAYHNEEQGSATIEFLKLFRWLLPCRYCRESFQAFADAPQTKSPVEYVYQLHSLVNQKLQKPDVEFLVFAERLKVFGAPLCETDIRNLFLLLVSNYDHNEDPRQRQAFLVFWRRLPDMIQTQLPKLAHQLRKSGPLPENKPLTGKMLRERFYCSIPDLKRVNIIRS